MAAAEERLWERRERETEADLDGEWCFLGEDEPGPGRGDEEDGELRGWGELEGDGVSLPLPVPVPAPVHWPDKRSRLTDGETVGTDGGGWGRSFFALSLFLALFLSLEKNWVRTIEGEVIFFPGLFYRRTTKAVEFFNKLGVRIRFQVLYGVYIYKLLSTEPERRCTREIRSIVLFRGVLQLRPAMARYI